MTITRDSEDVWNEVCDKAERSRLAGTPIYTLVREIPNYIVRVEADRILRQSSDPFSDEGGPSEVMRRDIVKIWDELREHGQAVEGEIHALRFAWTLIAKSITGLKFDRDPFRLTVGNEELANRVYGERQVSAEPSRLPVGFVVLMQHSPEFSKYDDQIGVQYHYPSQYFDRVVQGERFIYCRPQENAPGAGEKQSQTLYFGTGRIGAIRQDLTKDGHRYCQIEEYFPFPNEVSYRDNRGDYLETGSAQIPVMQSAVRVISKEAFERIISHSGLDQHAEGFFGQFETAETDVEQIRVLNQAYRNATPQVKQYLTRRVERGVAIGGRVKEMNQYVCQVCGARPFVTRTGRPYAEAHHVVPLQKLESGSLASQNVICLCANCHRKMHYGNVELAAATSDSITFEVNGDRITIQRNRV
jgi:5-methylcytosine-specific restriction endonuclease McrA